MEQKQFKPGERVVILFNMASKVVLFIAVLALIVGFAMYSGFNNPGGVSLMMCSPFLLIASLFIKGFEIVIRAAARYLQINGEPYGK